MDFECGACGKPHTDSLSHMETCPGPFPESWWHEDIGDVLWWCWRDGAWLQEAPYVGTPLDLGHTVEMHDGKNAVQMHVGGWPGYHTHWTHLPELPEPPHDV